jgi:hypothetical protein
MFPRSTHLHDARVLKTACCGISINDASRSDPSRSRNQECYSQRSVFWGGATLLLAEIGETEGLTGISEFRETRLRPRHYGLTVTLSGGLVRTDESLKG